MDLELREALALAEDRNVALSQLLPGSEDHDYYRCLHAQHAGQLDEADAILHRWPERHGKTERYNRLRFRQMLWRASSEREDVTRVANDLRDWFGVQHWHEAEVETVDPTRPTRIADGAFDGQHLLRQAVAHDAALSQVTDEGLLELLDAPPDPSRLRVMLGRIGHTPHPAIVPLVASDLAQRGSGGFGSLAIHDQLTLDQLHALRRLRPELEGHLGWVSAVVKRMVPSPALVDLELDLHARHAYLLELWELVGRLPPAVNSLKAHVLWHLLDTRRRLAIAPDVALLRAYLEVPRTAGYVSRDWLGGIHRDAYANVAQDFRAVTGLPPAGNDEALVRALLEELLDDAEPLAPYLDRRWFDAVIAEARLLRGVGDPEKATRTLGPAHAAAVRERVELVWCPHNPTRFAANEAVTLEADIKHVGELVVKVFRIDPLAYFQSQRREVGPDLDLDGLAASHEQVLRFSEPPVRRVRRRIELPMCARPGTYVVDLIGNGISSRAVLHKGRLRQMMRLTPTGHLITIVDEAAVPQPGARAWLGDREYVANEHGAFVVPFSTSPGAGAGPSPSTSGPGRTPLLLFTGDVASVEHVTLYREAYELTATVLLDREGLTAGRAARAIVRAQLTLGGAPVSIAQLKRTTWDVTLTDAHGVTTTKSQPLVLVDDDAAVLEWPLGEDTRRVELALRGAVEIRSEQREQELVVQRAWTVGTMHGTTAVEALYLARAEQGFVVSALGKTGEPRAQRPVTIALVHRWSRMQLNFELATDARGRVELGALPGISRISATLGSTTQSWWIEDHLGASSLQVAAGRDVVIPIAPSREASDLLRRMSLVQLVNGVPAAHPKVAVETLEDGLVIRGLAPGSYHLRAPGLAEVAITVLEVQAEIRNVAFTPAEVGELSRHAPAIADITITDALRIRLRAPTSRTRVHVIATTFVPKLLELPWIGARGVGRRTDRQRGAIYVSGRELGDEYRYILDRRNHKRFPGLLLDRPGLLLNPWSRRTTSTETQAARAGGAFARAPAPAQAAYMPMNAPPGEGGGGEDEQASYDFLGAPPVVLANLEPEGDTVEVAISELGGAMSIAVIVDDPAGMMVRYLRRPESAIDTRDLRLKLALDPARHAMQTKTVQPLVPGARLVIEDLATAKVHLLDSLERAHGYLLALRDDATLREFSWITRWHELPDGERRERYSKYACHELHLFLYVKDRGWFDAVVRPYLAHKRTKTFVDHWLLDDDLTRYLEPGQLAQLNAVERALLARRLPAAAATIRLLADEVAVQQPDPSLDTRVIDGLIGASTLDSDDAIAAAKEEAYDLAERSVTIAPPMAMASLAAPAPRAAGAPMPPPMGRRAVAKTVQRQEKAKKRDTDAEYDESFGDDLEAPAPHYRAIDKTQEWAENNWWHRTPAESSAAMILPNRLWRDLAAHREGPFLSPWLGLATSSFAEAMCALAVIDLPFVPAPHAITPSGPRLEIVAAGNALAGSAQIVDGELVATGAPLVVGMSYVRDDDRYDWIDGEQVDKYVETFSTGVVYTCLVVLANSSSSRQRIQALVQIPRGSIAVAGARATQTIDVVLEPYGTHGHEVGFYFPAPGSWSHFPVHVRRGGVIVAAAPGRTLEVQTGGATADPRSWAHRSQRGSAPDVAAFLADANLASIDLTRIAWRMRDRAAYELLVGTLERRQAFDDTLWAYALLHGDRARIRRWLRSRGAQLLQAGPALEPLAIDAEQLGAYEHLEYAPLVNARAHRLGAKVRILNDGLAAQYTRFLELVAHRATPTAEDLLAATVYLLAQDRIEQALAMFTRVDATQLVDRMQHDYVAAYVACLTADTRAAREHATRWREHPVDRWRHRFGALLAMLDEVDGASPAVVDPRSREQQHADLAAKQPAFDLALGGTGIAITSQHVAALELRFFEMDIELLFSRQPFVQSDVSRFSFIEPGHREQLTQLPPELRVPWPAALRGKNVVVEAVGAGQRKAKVHYANDLATNLSHQVGQVRVTRASDRASLPATYVKVYARRRGGGVTFYKDGYTDLRGWFDYATLSTNDLDSVERFAILVCSDGAGATILEAAPPAR